MKLTLFLDTSALVKLYVEEPESQVVYDLVNEASGVVVSTLALPEAAAALFAKARAGIISEKAAGQALSSLREQWESLERVPLQDHIAEEAAILARSKGLRGADAVQLATCALLSRERRGVRFLAFDEALNQAAVTVVKLAAE